MPDNNLSQEVRAFIEKNFPGGSAGIDPAASLSKTGVLDSMGVVEVIDFIESTYGVTVEDDEVGQDNFDSIASIVAFIEKKGGRRVEA